MAVVDYHKTDLPVTVALVHDRQTIAIPTNACNRSNNNGIQSHENRRRNNNDRKREQSENKPE